MAHRLAGRRQRRGLHGWQLERTRVVHELLKPVQVEPAGTSAKSPEASSTSLCDGWLHLASEVLKLPWPSRHVVLHGRTAEDLLARLMEGALLAGRTVQAHHLGASRSARAAPFLSCPI